MQVTNHTEGEIVAKWSMPRTKTYFSIVPEFEKLAPGTSFIFTIRFQNSSGQESLFGGELELNCFYSIMLDYSELKTEFISPGWSRTLSVSANTFASSSEAFPSLVDTPNLITFPPAPEGHPTYRTVMIKSKYDLPVAYKLEDQNYQIYPNVGIINSCDKFQMVILRAITKAYEHTGQITAQFNNDTRNNRDISVKTLGTRNYVIWSPYYGPYFMVIYIEIQMVNQS